MRAAIHGPLKSGRGYIWLDWVGERHWHKTVESLVRRKAMEIVRINRWHKACRLTEVGMLAALWLEQEATTEEGAP